MTVPLPPYSGDQVSCVKCGHTEARTRWRAAGTHSGNICAPGPSGLPERLERECERCDYEWAEALAEVVVPDEPDTAAFITHRLGLAVHLLDGHRMVECDCADDHRCDGWRCGKCGERWPCCPNLAIGNISDALDRYTTAHTATL